MIGLQRVIAFAMAAVMVCVFLVPLALQRHEPRLAAGLIVIFLGYAVFNVVLFVRMRRRRS